MSSNPQQLHSLINTYKKLFLALSAITLMGIAVVLLGAPILPVVVIGLCFIIIKTLLVYSSFKDLLAGRNLLVMIFVLTGLFFITLVLTPLLGSKMHIVGTEDTSKQYMIDHPVVEEGHHGH